MFRLDAVPKLNLGVPLWRLKDGEASEVLGVDVVEPKRLRPDRGRKPLGVYFGNLPTGRGDLTSLGSMGGLVQTIVTRNYNVLPQFSTLFFAHLHPAGTASYDPSTGYFTRSSLFTSYVPRGDDYVQVMSPSSLQGKHKIFARVSNDSIILPQGLTGATETVTEAVICQYPGLFPLTVTVDGVVYRYLVKSSSLYEKEGPWSEGVINGLIRVNEDNRLRDTFGPSSARSQRDPLEVGMYAQMGDTLILSGLHSLPQQTDKVSVTYPETSDFRGFLVSDGRYFWIQRGGTYDLLLDLGDDSFLGKVWRFARISNDLLLLTCPDCIPRILRLSQSAMSMSNIQPSGDEIYAGCMAPVKPPPQETYDELYGLSGKGSWLACKKASVGGDLTSGTYMRMYIRGANYADGIYTDFIPVFRSDSDSDSIPTTGTSEREIPVDEDSAVAVFTAINSSSERSPPLHQRITHLEFWRTQSSVPSTYYLESVALIVPHHGEYGDTNLRSLLGPTLKSGSYPVNLNDNDLPRLPILTSTTFAGNGLPPICKEATSLGGVTLCFGKASASPERATIYSMDFFGTDVTYTPSTGAITQTGLFTNYSFLDGDLLQVVFGGANESSEGFGQHLPEGEYEILSRSDANTILINQNLAPDVIDGIKIACYVKRPYTFDWPRIVDDEIVHYSRTDYFQPEGFPNRTKTLSRIGDTFRRAVAVGNYIAAIMDQGIHLLFLNGTVLDKDTIADRGAGTPWPDSVVVVEHTVYWATPRGLKRLVVANDVNDEGFRAKLSSVGEDELEPWFRTALSGGYTVDAGYDPENHCLRFRRNKPGGETGTYESQTIVLSLRNGLASLLDDDYGFRYAPSMVAEVTESEIEKLYSIEKHTGAIFEVHNRESYPFTGCTVRDDLVSDRYISCWPPFIRSKPGSGVVFSTKMIGCLIRFSNGLTGLIRAVSNENRTLAFFPSVQVSPYALSLDHGHSFEIVPNRFRISPAPLMGMTDGTPKTIESLKATVYSGESDRPVPGNSLKLTVREDFGGESGNAPIDVFDEGASGKTTADRVSSLTGQGNVLALGIESLEGQPDFQVASVEMTILEELTETADEER